MDGGGDGRGESSPDFVLVEELGDLEGLELELELPLDLVGRGGGTLLPSMFMIFQGFFCTSSFHCHTPPS